MSQLTIVCVLKNPVNTQNKLSGHANYSPDWVTRLQRNVKIMAPPHRFVCLSDVDVGCERIPLLHGWPGWWSKLELWREGLFTGRVLYLDLDVLVTGNLDILFEGNELIAWKDPRFPGINSSVMSWNAGDGFEFYQDFDPSTVIPRLASDQSWMNELRPDIKTFFPGLIVSFKDDCYSKFLPYNARVVCCHGRPKPPEIKLPWFVKRWNCE